MKKILNRPADYVDEMLQGLVAAHPQFYRLVGETSRAVARATPGKPGKVGIVSGGGSGHLPVFTGYVGPGLLDACAIGDVFASHRWPTRSAPRTRARACCACMATTAATS